MIIRVYDSVSDDREEQERKKIEKRWVQVQNEVQEENGSPASVDK
jgi:hypothetical protein